MFERHDDALTLLQLMVWGPNLDDLAHELVAQHVARLHRRHQTVHQMKIGAADRAARHP